MEIDRKELKRRARADMGAAKPPFWAVLLAYLLLTTGVSDLLYLVPLPGGDGIPTTSICFSNVSARSADDDITPERRGK